MMERYQDPNHAYNSSVYHAGKMCIECRSRPAGTAWSPYWCQPCNAARMDRIGSALGAARAKLDAAREAGKESAG